MIAAHNNMGDIVQLLLNRHAKVDLQSSLGNTALHRAILRDHHEVALILIEHMTLEQLDTLVAHNDITVLHYATQCNDIRTLEALIEKGVNIDKPTSCQNSTALHYAILARNVAAMEKLIEAGANTSLTLNLDMNVKTTEELAKSMGLEERYQQCIEARDARLSQTSSAEPPMKKLCQKN